MKKIFRLMISLMVTLLVFINVGAEEIEQEFVTKYTPIYTNENGVFTYSHGQFKHEPTNTLGETYTYQLTVDGVAGEVLEYIPGDVIEWEAQDYDKHNILMSLWTHYPDGKPLAKHQLGQTRQVVQKQFNWDWTYEAPTCEGLKVTFPVDLPHDAIDVNIRVKDLITGEVKTYNFRDDEGFELGVEHVFRIELEYFEYQWIQVHGTNYHWEGSVVCGNLPEVPEVPKEPEPPIEEPTPPIEETPIEETPIEEVEDIETVHEDVEELPQTGVSPKYLALVSIALGSLLSIYKKKEDK